MRCSGNRFLFHKVTDDLGKLLTAGTEKFFQNNEGVKPKSSLSQQKAEGADTMAHNAKDGKKIAQ